MVNPKNKPVVLVVHGVQTGTDAGLNQDVLIKNLLTRSLKDVGATLEFDVDLYRYENINDAAQAKYNRLISLLLASLGAGAPLALPAGTVADLVGDVVTAAKGTATARVIREGLIERVLTYYAAGRPLYLVAHSLGTIYSFDAVNALISRRPFFASGDKARATWPVWGLMTLGSPIGLKLFDGRAARPIAVGGAAVFPWINAWDPLDPVVSGNVFGMPEKADGIAEKFRDSKSLWLIDDLRLDSGKQWLLAHTSYWNSPEIGDAIKNWLAT